MYADKFLQLYGISNQPGSRYSAKYVSVPNLNYYSQEVILANKNEVLSLKFW